MIRSYRMLAQNTAEGKRLVVDENQNGKVDSGESRLVKQGQDGWRAMEQLDAPIDRFTLEKDFGLWTDKEVSHTEGWFWNRHKVVDRELDAKIDADEVSQTTWKRFGNSYRLGAEVAKDGDGRFQLDYHAVTYGGLRVIGESDINWQGEYRENDSNWIVPTTRMGL